MTFLFKILSFCFMFPFMANSAQERIKIPSTYSTYDVLGIKKDSTLLESFIVEILNITNPQDRWNKFLFLIDNNLQIMKNIKNYKIKIKSGDLSDDWIKIISK
ncbi:MAG: hypothetical protein BGO07_02180 [Alphaproteobacteria bacterium 40-19]|nr:MAG: hypothetical protein BGO07_02180 [Alphaproteobacteria bacterium 40-19]